MIPKHAKLAFKGQIFSVYQWPQKMFDGSYQTFERIKRQDTVIIIAIVKNKIVLLKQKQPGTNWYLCEPAGRMDVPGESPKSAALRELLEETGMIPEKMFLWKKLESPGKIAHTVYIFVARSCKIVTGQKLDNGEKIQLSLISFKDFLKLSDNPKYIAGSLMEFLLRARISRKERTKLKKAIFG
jgi:ADP-ribose pyrophosphatase